ncbi:hypothetical protein TNCT_64471 [Trichonephila clavata]|uniref:Uncharacterized protein n=1 Tax=Trichonephila clavata TaxID=2740835 RepID=A0A8X6HEX8_TRICU|nr:hypothetical protein TNCT_64471 [Trichonephila clavata]
MDDMNPDESEKQTEGESEDEDGPLPELKNQFAPLASASEAACGPLLFLHQFFYPEVKGEKLFLSPVLVI